MANFDWVPQELTGRFSYINGKLVASCEVCGATKATPGRGAVVREIESGKFDRFRFCSIHGDFLSAKPSPEDVASWPVDHKRCRRCLKIKPFSEFHKHKHALMGYAVECKECRIPASKAAWATQSFERTLLAASKYRAKKFGIPHTISIDDIVIPELCPILRVPIVLERRHAYGPSIDQINPMGGYTPSNIQITSLRGNLLKNNMTAEEAFLVSTYLSNVGSNSDV